MTTRVQPVTAAQRGNRQTVDDDAAWHAMAAPLPHVTLEVTTPQRGKRRRQMARIEAWGAAHALMEMQGDLLQRFSSLQARVLAAAS